MIGESLKDVVDMAERRLQTFCGLVNAGQAQGGGREFSRQIDAQFRQIRHAIGLDPFDPHWRNKSNDQ